MIVPSDWTAISNSLETEILTDLDQNDLINFDRVKDFSNKYEERVNVFTFNQTPYISCYLFGIVAGPYEYIENNGIIMGREDPLRMRIYYRRSLKSDVERIKDCMYMPVVLGINWYSQFFGFNFPYEKYDQILCPEFRYGAMENVGCVTFTEKYLRRGNEISEANILNNVNVILHELCHQWFGNLVTMSVAL